ncbi:GspH/FimT family pseudopilin [Polaromonas sp.]|uniref:GspH/FimT family pseudopilin n=1 Tax=Polaromonas sp. TaxID=1869339 RepID=UPI003CC60942
MPQYSTTRLKPPASRPDRTGISPRRSSSGFTIIELMVAIVVLGVILAFGLPNLREFLVRNQVGTITSEFASDIARARVEAISRNNCVTICMSSNTANALTGGTPTCAGAGTNWQAGWIVFSNPSCSPTQDDPTTVNSTLIAVRQAGADSFTLTPASGTLRRLIFDSRGLAALTQETFTLSYTPEAVGSPHYRTICLSTAGRVITKKGGSTCP